MAGGAWWAAIHASLSSPRSLVVDVRASGLLLRWNCGYAHILCFFFFFLLVMLPSEIPDGEGNGTPRQYSCLENPMAGGAW